MLTVVPLRAAEQDVLVVVGEADFATAGQLRDDLVLAVATARRSVLVELGALQFCDLSGLRALQDAARSAEDAGVRLAFRGMSRQLGWLCRTFPPAGAEARAPARQRAGCGAAHRRHAAPTSPGNP